jgi:hypothetical protein
MIVIKNMKRKINGMLLIKRNDEFESKDDYQKNRISSNWKY